MSPSARGRPQGVLPHGNFVAIRRQFSLFSSSYHLVGISVRLRQLRDATVTLFTGTNPHSSGTKRKKNKKKEKLKCKKSSTYARLVAHFPLCCCGLLIAD